MISPSKGETVTHMDAAPGRLPVPCSVCSATVAYVSGRMVDRAKLYTGASGKPTTEYVRLASEAGAIRCADCERLVSLQGGSRG